MVKRTSTTSDETLVGTRYPSTIVKTNLKSQQTNGTRKSVEIIY